MKTQAVALLLEAAHEESATFSRALCFCAGRQHDGSDGTWSRSVDLVVRVRVES
jgi:hypothetical protein